MSRAEIVLEDTNDYYFMNICSVHNIHYQKYGMNLYYVYEEDLSKILYFIDVRRYQVQRLRSVLQRAGEEAFGW